MTSVHPAGVRNVVVEDHFPYICGMSHGVNEVCALPLGHENRPLPDLVDIAERAFAEPVVVPAWAYLGSAHHVYLNEREALVATEIVLAYVAAQAEDPVTYAGPVAEIAFRFPVPVTEPGEPTARPLRFAPSEAEAVTARILDAARQ